MIRYRVVTFFCVLFVNQIPQYFFQGDAERVNGREPIPMMDRQRAHELPQMQVGFMRGICCPCYELISEIIPQAEQLRERSKYVRNGGFILCHFRYNCSKWEELAEEQKKLQELEEENGHGKGNGVAVNGGDKQ